MKLRLILLVVVLALPAGAQDVSRGSLVGTVSDSSGALIGGASVRVTQEGTAAVFTTSTDSHGLFRFPALSTGNYEVMIEHPGFAAFLQKNITLTVGAEISLTVRLVLAGVKEKVEVKSVPPMIETTRTSASGTVDSRSVTDLPVNGRNFVSLVALAPGVNNVGEFPIFSGQTYMNSLLVDGANHNSFSPDFVGTMFSDRYLFSQEAVAEFQVNLNSYSAEFGRGGGGVINVVTKSGTNDLHGALFWYYRDRGLNATGFIHKLNGEPKDPLHVHQFGGSVGGPIVRNRLFFYGNFDAQRRSEENLTLLSLPSGFAPSVDPATAATQQRALSYLRERASPYIRTLNQNVSLMKLDWRLNSSQLLSGRWNRHRLLGGNFASSGVDESLEHNGTVQQIVDSLAVTLRSVISASAVNTALFSYVSDSDPIGRNNPNPEASVFEGGFLLLRVGGRSQSPSELDLRRAEWSDTLALSRGNHALKLGGDLSLEQGRNFGSNNFYGGYRFGSLASFGKSLDGTPGLGPGGRYIQAFSGIGHPPVEVHPDDVDVAGFVQDEWRAFTSLTLSGGLRYEVQTFTNSALKNPAVGLAKLGVDTSFIPRNMRNISPRLGLAWAPQKDGGLVIRAGYGMYFSRLLQSAAARGYSEDGIIAETRSTRYGDPDASWAPAYPNNVCGPPGLAELPPNCPMPVSGTDIIMGFSKSFQQPVLQHYHLSVEYQLGENLQLGISYSGVDSTHLLHRQDVNLSNSIPATIGIAGRSTVLPYRWFPSPRPSPDFDRVLPLFSNGNAVYHSLVVQMTKRFSANFQFLASYTWGKAIDDNPLPGAGGGVPASDYAFLSDPLDPRKDRGTGDVDQKHRLVASGIWELNYGREWANPIRKVSGGWELSGIFTAGSGFPYSGILNYDLNNDGNPSTDRLPGLGRNTFRTPSIATLDLRVARNFQLARQARLQARCDAFNVFNRTNILTVRNNYYAYSKCGIAGMPCLIPQTDPLTGFGTPVATLGARILQLSLRISF